MGTWRFVVRLNWIIFKLSLCLWATLFPSQLLSAPNAASAFCAAFHRWCQGWLYLLSLSFCDFPYAWNILLALIQETTFFYHPLWSSFLVQHPLDELIQEKYKKQTVSTGWGFLHWLWRLWIWSQDILFPFFFFLPFFLLLFIDTSDISCIEIMSRVSWGLPVHTS